MGFDFGLVFLQFVLDVARTVQERLNLNALANVLETDAFIEEERQKVLPLNQCELFALACDLLWRKWRNVQTLVFDNEGLPKLVKQIVAPCNRDVAILVTARDRILVVVWAQRLLLELGCAQVKYEVPITRWLELAWDVLVPALVIEVRLLG